MLLTPPGSLGALDRAVDRLAALGLGPELPATCVIAAAGHPVTRHGVSTYDDSVTREVLEATVAGESLGAVAARLVGAEVVAVDAGVPGDPVAGAVVCRPGAPQGDLVSADALAADDAERLVAAGRDLGRGLGRRLVTLGEVGIGNTTVASALVAARLGLDVGDAVIDGYILSTTTTKKKNNKKKKTWPWPADRAEHIAATFFGIFAPAGTPQPIVEQLNAAIVKVESDPDFQQKFLTNRGPHSGVELGGTVRQGASRRPRRGPGRGEGLRALSRREVTLPRAGSPARGVTVRSTVPGSCGICSRWRRPSYRPAPGWSASDSAFLVGYTFFQVPSGGLADRAQRPPHLPSSLCRMGAAHGADRTRGMAWIRTRPDHSATVVHPRPVWRAAAPTYPT